MITIKELVARLGFDIDTQSMAKFDRMVSDAKTGMFELTQRVQKFGDTLQSAGFKSTAFLTVPIVLAGRAALKSASDAEESAQKFNVVFRDIRDQATKVADSFGVNFGLAKSSTRELLGATGDLLTGFGFTQEKALQLSSQVANLGGDLASFQNVQGGAAEAVTRLTKGILGETENLKSLGIVVQQDTKEFKDRVKTIQAMTGSTLIQAKAEAILQIAVEQSKNAIGDFARTSSGHANQMRILKSRIEDVSVSFGRILLPVATQVAGYLVKIFSKIEKMPESLKKMIVIGAVFAAAFGPILLVLGSIISSVSAISGAIIFLKGFIVTLAASAGVSIGSILGLFAGLVAAIIAISGLVYLIIDDFSTWAKSGDSFIGSIIGKFDEFRNFVSTVFSRISSIISSFWNALTTNSQESWNKFLSSLWEGIKDIPKAVGFISQKLLMAFANIVSSVALIISNTIFKILSFIISRVAGLGSAIGKSLYDGIASSKIGKLISGIISSVPQAFNSAQYSNPYMAGITPLIPAPARTLSSISPPNRSSQTNVNVKNSIGITVPPGTTEQQKKFLEDAAMQSFEKAFSKKISESFLAVPRGEQ